jgi:hypothetical protein
MKNSSKMKVALTLGGIGLLGAGAVLGAVAFPNEVAVPVEVKVPVEVPVEIVKEVTVEKVVEVPVAVPVDNGNLQVLLDEMVERDGEMSWLTDGIDEDETELLVERLLMSHEWDRKALSAVQSELADELDKIEVDGTEMDEDEIRSIRINLEDVTLENIDWDDQDADVMVPFTLRQDDEKFEGVAIVEIREGKVDELIVDSISKQ